MWKVVGRRRPRGWSRVWGFGGCRLRVGRKPSLNLASCRAWLRNIMSEQIREPKQMQNVEPGDNQPASPSDPSDICQLSSHAKTNPPRDCPPTKRVDRLIYPGTGGRRGEDHADLAHGRLREGSEDRQAVGVLGERSEKRRHWCSASRESKVVAIPKSRGPNGPFSRGTPTNPLSGRGRTCITGVSPGTTATAVASPSSSKASAQRNPLEAASMAPHLAASPAPAASRRAVVVGPARWGARKGLLAVAAYFVYLWLRRRREGKGAPWRPPSQGCQARSGSFIGNNCSWERRAGRCAFDLRHLDSARPCVDPGDPPPRAGAARSGRGEGAGGPVGGGAPCPDLSVGAAGHVACRALRAAGDEPP